MVACRSWFLYKANVYVPLLITCEGVALFSPSCDSDLSHSVWPPSINYHQGWGCYVAQPVRYDRNGGSGLVCVSSLRWPARPFLLYDGGAIMGTPWKLDTHVLRDLLDVAVEQYLP